MEGDGYLCPDCSGQLLSSPLEGRRQYLCQSCGGHVLMIAVLRALSPDTAKLLWFEDPQGTGPGNLRCPFCTRPMQDKAVASGTAAVCKLCEAVWLDRQAAAQVEVKKMTDSTSLASATLHCPQCGAPVQTASDDKCAYCGAALHPPTKVVVIAQPEDEATGRPYHQAGGLLGALVDGVLNWPL